jgi:hypothetical protein
MGNGTNPNVVRQLKNPKLKIKTKEIEIMKLKLSLLFFFSFWAIGKSLMITAK